MIRSITMKNCGSYGPDGIEISDCKQINILYGPNGSGKTTVSNFLAAPEDPRYQSCGIQWEGAPREILVYNRKFREKNFASGEIAGVFTLGEETKENLQLVKKLEKDKQDRERQLEANQQTLNQTMAVLKKKNEDFESAVWNEIYLRNKDRFSEAFQGQRNNRKKMMEKVLEKLDEWQPTSQTLESLEQRAKILYGAPPAEVRELRLIPEGLVTEIAGVEGHGIWSRVIVGNNDLPIAGLIQHLGNADWVNAGRRYLAESDVCPFCQQKLDRTDLAAQIEAFFSGAYEQDVRMVADQRDRYNQLWQEMERVLADIRSQVNSIPEQFLDKAAFDANVQLALALRARNLHVFETKTSEPSRPVELEKAADVLMELEAMLIRANGEIRANNVIAAHHRKEKDKLSEDVWAYILQQNKKMLDGYVKEIKNLRSRIDGVSKSEKRSLKDLEAAKNALWEANSRIKSIQPTIDRINRSLQNYGFRNFKIVPSQVKDHYQICRPDGTLVADTLSEGEETFLAFLYFMQRVEGEIRTDAFASRRVVVIDDPICSLDSTILYIVSTMIKALFHKVRKNENRLEQVFVLTHNVFFHKEISFGNSTKDDDKQRYWVLRKELEATTVKSYGTTNPIKTSYELLWEEIRDRENPSPITLQNTMRRIIENYFGMIGDRYWDRLSNQFESMEERQICDSLFYWINDGSHTMPDDLYIDIYNDMVPRYMEVFRKIFEYAGHEAHYKMMMHEK